MNIGQLVVVAHGNARIKGFYEPEPTFGDQIALCTSELSEALEAFRDRGLDSWHRADGKPEGVASELADAMIRIADMAGHFGLDLEGALVEKVAYNATRPFRHGGKRL